MFNFQLNTDLKPSKGAYVKRNRAEEEKAENFLVYFPAIKRNYLSRLLSENTIMKAGARDTCKGLPQSIGCG